MEAPNLQAAIDMGTNSFKMLVVRAHPNGRFLSLDHLKDPVLLGRGFSTLTKSLTVDSINRSILALRKFSHYLNQHRIRRTKIVATSAVREASNGHELVSRVRDELGFEVNVLSGEEEARLVYLGILQCLPVYSRPILAIDIGGGSTEFVLGIHGEVVFSTSLRLGHVSLTESFVKSGDIENMRRHIRSVIIESGLVDKVKEIGFEVAVGSSGTIRSIERAISIGKLNKDWRFTKEELRGIVGRLGEEEARNVGFSKRRSEFIVAGAILLLEIFEILGIDGMEVSEYALGEGLIAETLAEDCEGYDVNANARWRSVVRLASMFDGGRRMESSVRCTGIAKEIIEGIKKCHEVANYENKFSLWLDEKDHEHLDAAILLHNIGVLVGKKGYHKHSYHIIKNGDQLKGYNPEEVELIALLARYHRKKFPRCEHDSLQRFPEEVRQKFLILIAIVRVSVALQHCQHLAFQGLEISHSHEGLKLVLNVSEGQSVLPGNAHPMMMIVETELNSELEHFKAVFQQKLSIVVSQALKLPTVVQIS